MRLHAWWFMPIHCPLPLRLPQKSHYHCPAQNMQRSGSESADALLFRWTTSGWVGNNTKNIEPSKWRIPVLFLQFHSPRASGLCCFFHAFTLSSWLPFPSNFWSSWSISAKCERGVEAFSILQPNILHFILWKNGRDRGRDTLCYCCCGAKGCRATSARLLQIREATRESAAVNQPWYDLPFKELFVEEKLYLLAVELCQLLAQCTTAIRLMVSPDGVMAPDPPLHAHPPTTVPPWLLQAAGTPQRVSWLPCACWKGA